MSGTVLTRRNPIVGATPCFATQITSFARCGPLGHGVDSEGDVTAASRKSAITKTPIKTLRLISGARHPEYPSLRFLLSVPSAHWHHLSVPPHRETREGHDCQTNWYEGNDGPLGKPGAVPRFSDHAPALLGFDETIDGFCWNAKKFTKNHKYPGNHAGNCVNGNLNILSLYGDRVVRAPLPVADVRRPCLQS